MWLYSSPLEVIVVVVITGTDRTVISYININSLIKLRHYGINGVPLNWLINYLTGRQ